MFSGIVQAACQVIDVQSQSGLTRLVIELGPVSKDLARGASVSIAGVCLTALDHNATRVSFEVMDETLNKTTLGKLQVGEWVNVERSLRLGDEVGGHCLSGHVTGVALIRAVRITPQNCAMTFGCDQAWMEFIFPKGFIALDGCSLTVVDTGEDWFTVHFIPETLRVTTFGRKKIGDAINLELDARTQATVETVKQYLKTHAAF